MQDRASALYRSTSPPVPPGYPVVGVIPNLIKGPAQYCTQVMYEYGGVARLNMGLASVYLITHPDCYQHVLVDNNQNYWKGTIFERMRFLFGNAMVLNDGDLWRQQRRLMQPAFHRKRLHGLIPIMAEIVNQKIAVWEQAQARQQPLEMWQEMMSLTLPILVKTMFSFGINDEELAEITGAFNAVLKHLEVRLLTFFLPDQVPLPRQRQAREALATLDRIVYRLIRERRQGHTTFDDLFEMLLNAKDQDTGQGMSDQQLRDEIVSLFFGGYESTASALAWIWYFLAQNPSVTTKLEAEIESILGGEPPTFETLGELTYTQMVIQETMRIHPPFWNTFRTSYEADEIDGFYIPPNAPLLLCPYATHRHPDYWPEPNRFDPERFRPEVVRDRHRLAYLPFGGGQRVCMGQHMAMLEMSLIVAMLARKFRPQLALGHTVEIQVRATIKARNGIMMVLPTGPR